jgi:MoaA/NifB/PqqE/SkfB family radical SAM enzyme
MCSQPPQDRDDTDALTQRNLNLIKLIEKPPARLVITGGEPTLLGERLFAIIASVRDKFPETYLHMLTNGRAFAWPSYTARLAALKHPNLVLGVPLYSDDSTIHDYVVQAKGAFDQTVNTIALPTGKSFTSYKLIIEDEDEIFDVIRIR